jgi:hypothetical protein
MGRGLPGSAVRAARVLYWLLASSSSLRVVHSGLIGSWSTLTYPVHLPLDGIFASFLFWVP